MNLSVKSLVDKSLSLRYLLFFGVFICIAVGLIGCKDKRGPESADSRHIEQRINAADSMAVTGDYVHALDSLHSISRDLELMPDISPELIVRTNFLIGRIHSIYGDSEAAMKYYNKAAERLTDGTDAVLKMRLFSNMYEAYASRGEYDKAKESIQAIYQLDIKPERRKLFHYYFSSGDLAYKEGRYNDALKFYRKSIESIDGHDVPLKMLSYPYSEMAETFKKMGETDSAFVYLKKFEESAEKESEPFVKASALRELMLWSARMDDPAMTRNYMQSYFTYMDSLIDVRGFLRAKENIHLYEERLNSEKIKDMSERVSKGRKTITHLFIILAVMLVLSLFVFIYSSTVRRKNKFLYQKNQELSDMEQQYRSLLASVNLNQSADNSIRDESSIDNESDKDYDLKKDLKPLTEEASRTLLTQITKVMELSKPYLDPEFSLQSLAAMVDSNTKYVSAAINDLTGLNFRSFVNNYRIKEAERRLRDRANYGNYTIQWIGESVGIKSKSTFVAAFKKSTGLTPSVFLKYVREDDKRNGSESQ